MYRVAQVQPMASLQVSRESLQVLNDATQVYVLAVGMAGGVSVCVCVCATGACAFAVTFVMLEIILQ